MNPQEPQDGKQPDLVIEARRRYLATGELVQQHALVRLRCSAPLPLRWCDAIHPGTDVDSVSAEIFDEREQEEAAVR